MRVWVCGCVGVWVCTAYVCMYVGVIVSVVTHFLTLLLHTHYLTLHTHIT